MPAAGCSAQALADLRGSASVMSSSGSPGSWPSWATDVRYLTSTYAGTGKLARFFRNLVTCRCGAHHEEHRPGELHRQLMRVLAELSDATGAFLMQAVRDETRGWQWVTEPL